MYEVVTADKMELPLMVTDSMNELTSFLGISVHGVSTALRRGKNPKYHPRYYRLVRINDECVDDEISHEGEGNQAETIFDTFDERFKRRHR